MTLPQPGNYEVYAYVPNISFQFGRRRGNRNKDVNYNYTVYHDDGEEDVQVTVSNTNDGWLYLGEFYYSEGTAKVKLSDVSNNEYVIGDAVKWVKK